MEEFMWFFIRRVLHFKFRKHLEGATQSTCILRLRNTQEEPLIIIWVYFYFHKLVNSTEKVEEEESIGDRILMDLKISLTFPLHTDVKKFFQNQRKLAK